MFYLVDARSQRVFRIIFEYFHPALNDDRACIKIPGNKMHRRAVLLSAVRDSSLVSLSLIHI